METWHFIWMLAALTGLAVAGVTGSGWALVTGEFPRIWLLSRYSVAMPLKLAALLAYGPLGLVRAGLSHADQNPVLALLIVSLGLAWSFMHGVFIMVNLFGFT